MSRLFCRYFALCAIFLFILRRCICGLVFTRVSEQTQSCLCSSASLCSPSKEVLEAGSLLAEL